MPSPFEHYIAKLTETIENKTTKIMIDARIHGLTISIMTKIIHKYFAKSKSILVLVIYFASLTIVNHT